MPIEHSNFAAPLNGQTNHVGQFASDSILGARNRLRDVPATPDGVLLVGFGPSKLQHTSTESNLKRTGFQRSPGLSTTLETQNYESFVELQASSTPLDSAEDQHRESCLQPFKLEALNAEFLLGLVGLSQGITHLKLDNLLQVLDGETLLELNKVCVAITDCLGVTNVVQYSSRFPVWLDCLPISTRNESPVGRKDKPSLWLYGFRVSTSSRSSTSCKFTQYAETMPDGRSRSTFNFNQLIIGGRAGVGLSMDLRLDPSEDQPRFNPSNYMPALARFEPNPLRANKSDFNAHLQVARKRKYRSDSFASSQFLNTAMRLRVRDEEDGEGGREEEEVGIEEGDEGEGRMGGDRDGLEGGSGLADSTLQGWGRKGGAAAGCERKEGQRRCGASSGRMPVVRKTRPRGWMGRGKGTDGDEEEDGRDGGRAASRGADSMQAGRHESARKRVCVGWTPLRGG
ncbi:hypothetical protein C8R46DRAFT_1037462 [Mycena filopes]|nr:hypothetical protein C8R46DRAFT_1037462 [Mycena filopes]